VSNLVIVAIPDENDRVWQVSSEKVPHLTILFLGDEAQVANQDKIVEFTQHAADMMLNRFYLPVDRRGELGNDAELGPADVLFFRKSYDYRAIRDFRAALLKDSNIKTAYDNAQQFEGPWVPHLTLGYQGRPAKEETDPHPFYDVGFTKIAVWTGDSEGPEFLLKDFWDELELLENMPMDVAHRDKGAEFLEHYGIKGMHWGVRNTSRSSRPAPHPVAPTATSRVHPNKLIKTKIKTEGGENHPAHEDAIKVARAQAKLKKSGAAALSNVELKDVANRLELEQRVKILSSGEGKKFVTNTLKSQGQQSVSRAVTKKAVKLGF